MKKVNNMSIYLDKKNKRFDLTKRTQEQLTIKEVETFAALCKEAHFHNMPSNLYIYLHMLEKEGE